MLMVVIDGWEKEVDRKNFVMIIMYLDFCVIVMIYVVY